MNRRSFVSIPAGLAVLWATDAAASAGNEELKRQAAAKDAQSAGKMVYPYNEYTLHRVFSDKHGLPYAGAEDPTIYVLTSVTKDMCCDYSGYSFVTIVDGQPTKLLTNKEVIMIPRSKL